MLLELRSVSKRYIPEGSWIIKDLSFCLEKNRGIVIQGPSGSGKTTILGMIAGILPPSEGSVLFQGKDIYSLPEKEKAAFRNLHIGYCFQSNYFHKHLSVLENAILPLLFRGLSMAKALKKGEQSLESVDLADLAKKSPSELSGGQLQRLSLARAMIGCPEILLIDEPTGNLDEKTAQNIMQLILSFHTEKNASIVLVTHDAIPEQAGFKKYLLKNGSLQD